MKPNKNESKQDFLKRCTEKTIKGGVDEKAAFASCNLDWDDDRGQRSALSLTSYPKLKLGDGSGEKRRFLISAYTGKKIDAFWGDIIIDIDGISTKEKIPVLREHARDRIVGFGEAYKDEQLYVSGTFSENTDDAKEVLSLADEGYPWQASIRVQASVVESLKDENAESKVNGKTVSGPLEIWRKSDVGEVSFVTLGSDDDTAGISMSEKKYDAEIRKITANKTKTMEDTIMEITYDLIKNQHPEIVAEILKCVDIDYVMNNLSSEIKSLTEDAKKAGADAERARIQAVKEQSMPGHEALIEQLMFDGETEGAQAAVRVLQAEKKMRSQMHADLADDAPEPIEQPATDNIEAVNDDHLPIDKKCQSKWDKDKDLQKEFMGDFDGYVAYEKAIAAGKVKVLNK